MPYNPSQPPRLLIPNGQIDDPNQGLAIWGYTSPFDSASLVSAPGYFSNALHLNMQVGDFVMVYDVKAGITSFYYIGSFTGAGANLKPMRSGSSAVYVSDFGKPTFSDDTATVQAAFNAAVLSNNKLVFDDPSNGFGTWWYLTGTVQDQTGNLSAPQVVSVDTTTGVFTLDRSHHLTTGDVISFAGTNVGSGGGYSQVNTYTEYFVNTLPGFSAFTLYDTYDNSRNATSVGKYIPSMGIKTSATINAMTTTTALTNGITTVTVTDASKIINNDLLNLTGTDTATYYKVTNVSSNTITFTPAYSGTTINSGAFIWPTSLTVTSTLSLENGSTFSLTNPTTTNNFFGAFVITSIVGNTIHFQIPPIQFFPTPGVAQNLFLGIWLDPTYLNAKFEVSADPAVLVKKAPTFQGNAMLQFTYGTSVYMHDIEFWGLTYGPVYDPNIHAGDDGIRFLSCADARVERIRLRNFGDAAIRFNTSTYWVGARSTSHPNAGVFCNNIIVKDSFFHNVFQVSTTASDANYQGGVHNAIFINNFFENIGGSIKAANRAPGGANLYYLNNTFKHVGRDCLELDSYDNIVVDGNTFEDFYTSGVTVIANNLQPIGFSFNDLSIRNNVFKAGSFTNNDTSTAAILVNPDIYPDSTFWDFRGLDISGNRIYDMPSSSYPITLVGGSYQNATINNNILNNCASTTMFRMTMRISATAGLDNNIIISGNTIGKCSGTKATCFYFYPTNGAANTFQRGITITGNNFDNSDVTLGSDASNNSRFIDCDYVQDMHITNNFWRGYGTQAFYNQTQANNVVIQGNDFTNLNTANGGVFLMNNINGIRIVNNHLANSYGGSDMIFCDNFCQNLRIAQNDLYGSTATNLDISNNPLISNLDFTRREDTVSSAPNSGTWNAGDRYWFKTPASGTAMGAIATVGGSYSAITATANSSNGQPTLTNLSNLTNITVGTYLTHAGFTGTRKVLSMTATVVTLDANAGSNQTSQAVTVVNPTFKNMPSIA